MKTKILITGASGFIGSHLVELLLKQGESIGRLRLLVPNGESLDNLPKRDFDVVRGDIRNKRVVRKVMKDVGVVYHLAAMTIKPGRTYRDYKTTNVNGTQNLIDACRGRKLQKFVFFSSISVFGLPAHVGEIENWDEKRPKKPSEDYGRSKLEAEKRVIKAHKKWGMPYCIIRPTTVYGPRDHQSLLELYNAISGHYFFLIGKGENRLDYVYVKDLVKGARLAQLSKRSAGDYILGAGKPTSFKKIASLVAKSIGEDLPSIHIPKEIALLVSYVTSFFNKALKLNIPFYPDRVRVMTTTCYYNVSKASREINYAPRISLQKGTKLTGKWFASKRVGH